jgi:hypothetical protein
MELRPVGAVLFRADGRTNGRTGRHGEDNSRFYQFCERANSTQAIEPEPDNRTLSKGTTSSDELL